MSKLLPLAFACIASAPVFANTLPIETITAAFVDQTPATEAVASACVTNKTDYRVVFFSSWGANTGGWRRLSLRPGDSGLYSLVSQTEIPNTSLTLRFPASPTSNQAAEQVIPATWGVTREIDCAKLLSPPRFVGGHRTGRLSGVGVGRSSRRGKRRRPVFF